MTFKHKLSCRLALLRNVVLVGAACAVAACDLQQLLALLNPVAAVVVVPDTASMELGQTAQLVATPMDSMGRVVAQSVSWASIAPAVATVDGSGLVTGVAEGTATITATSVGHNGTAVVKVRRRPSAPVASVAVSPATASVGVGQTVQLTATPRDASGNALSGRVVTWASSAPAVAAVNGSGLVTGVAAGAATLTATSEGQSGGAAVEMKVGGRGHEQA